MSRAYISIGSNIDREHHIRAAIEALQSRYGELQISPIYESESVGFKGDNFYNLAVSFDTAIPVNQVLEQLREIEQNHGRDRSGARFSSRTLDLDLLLYDDLILHDEGIDLPRGEITENAFVLLPLADIAGDLLHPTHQRTIKELWKGFNHRSQQLWPIPFDLP